MRADKTKDVVRASFGRVLVVGAALVAGCDRSAPIGRASEPILNGVEDPADTAIVAVDTFLPTGEELCSGYVIMPDLVVTARHCAAPVVNSGGPCATNGPTLMASGGAPLDPSKLNVYTDSILTGASTPTAVVEVTVLPDSTGQSLCGNDMAILRLAAPLAGITPLAPAIGAPPTVGEGFTAIGYGVPTPADVAGSDRRRSRSGLAVSSVGASSRTVDGEWIADTGPCAGDSGSPAIDASGAAIGVMSRGPKATCVSMIYERVDTHADFLIAQAKASAARLGVPLPAWAGGPSGAGGAGGAVATSSTGTSTAKPPPSSRSSGGCSVGSWAEGPPADSASLVLFALGAVSCRRRARRRSPR